jgi:hypothetical protein
MVPRFRARWTRLEGAMMRSGVSAVVLASVLVLVGGSATAAGSAPVPALAPLVSDAPKPAARFGWAGIGVYDVRFNTPFGTVSDAEFGLNVGGAMTVAPLSPEVSLMGFGNIAMSFATGGQFFPITAGVAARFEKLPVQVLGGIGATMMLNSVSTDTGFGAGLLLMGIYPLPQVDPRLSAQAQIQYHLLTHSLSLLVFTIGAAYNL